MFIQQTYIYKKKLGRDETQSLRLALCKFSWGKTILVQCVFGFQVDSLVDCF